MKPLLSCFLLLTCLLPHLCAQWSTDPMVNTIINDDPGAQFLPKAISDGTGGAIVMWVEWGVDLYAQRIDGSGYLRWDPGGTPLCLAESYQYPLGITGDGAGGAICLWRDYRDVEGDIDFDTTPGALYVQHLDSTGTPTWTGDGIRIKPVTRFDPTRYETIISDGRGGAYVAWYNFTPSSIALQHIDSSGAALLDSGGLILFEPDHANTVHLILDAFNGVFVIFQHLAVRLSYNGEPLWDTPIVTGGSGFGNKAVTDGKGGFIQAGFISPGAEPERLRLQRISPHGERLWEEVNIYIGGREIYQWLQLIEDGNSGAFATWVHEEDGVNLTFFQHIDSTGNLLWGDDSTEYIHISRGRTPVVSDQRGGLIFAGLIQTDTIKHYTMVRINDNDFALWGAQGSIFRSSNSWPIGMGEVLTISDGFGGAIVIWDERGDDTHNYGIFSARVNRDGVLGGPVLWIQPEADGFIPQEFQLFQNYPNPFNTATRIKFALPRRDRISLKIYDLSGREVKLLQNDTLIAGTYSAVWDGTDNIGRVVGSGVYLCLLQGTFSRAMIKLAIIK